MASDADGERRGKTDSIRVEIAQLAGDSQRVRIGAHRRYETTDSVGGDRNL